MKLSEHQKRVTNAVVDAVARELLKMDGVYIDSVFCQEGTKVRYICHIEATENIDVIVPVRGNS